jgi:signal transduction histidine kinase/integral membrane sensor domain MASE1/ActR/RegA family two-component response regulator
MLTSDIYNQAIARWIEKHQWRTSIALIILYITFSYCGLFIAHIDDITSPIWPPFGVVIAAVLLARRTLLPSIFIAVLLSHIMTGSLITSALTIATGVTLSAYIASLLYSLVLKISPTQRAIMPIWIVCASLLAPMVSATFGVFSFYFLEPVPPLAPVPTVWLTWWMGDAIGALIIAPVLVTLRGVRLSVTWILKVLLLLLLVGTTHYFILQDESSSPLLFLAFPTLLIACHWFGPSGCAWTTLGFVACAVGGELVMADELTIIQFHENILPFDYFIFALATTSLTLSVFYQQQYFFLPSLMFLAGWTLCGWLHYSLKSHTEELNRIRLVEIASDIQQAIQSRLNIYINASRSGAGYLMNSIKMEPEEWHAYVQYLDIEKHYPGINGLGFIMPVLDRSLTPAMQFEQRKSLSAPPSQTTALEDETGESLYVITHIEPIETNQERLGFNIATDKILLSAAIEARDTGRPILTNRHIPELDASAGPEFSLFVPIYQRDMPIQTLTQRRTAFIGWSYATFFTEGFLYDILEAQADEIDFALYTSDTTNPEALIYKPSRGRSTPRGTDMEYRSRLELAEQIFSFIWKPSDHFRYQDTHSPIIATSSLALGISFLVAAFVSLRSTNRQVNDIVKIKTGELLKANEHLTQEVQERKRAESEAEAAKRTAEAANHAKSEFLATMSHEIRTPMNSVIGFSELLVGSKLNAEQRLWTHYIQTAGNNLLHLISEILDISKIEAGKLTLETVTFSIHKLGAEIVGSFQTTAAEKAILLNYTCDPDVPQSVIGDPNRIKQIMTNLIANALKFTAKGSVDIHISWMAPNVIIRIADSGIGIEPSMVDHLFDKFTQADSSTTRQYGGTGLGLAICKELTQMMRGEIHADSTLGEGTCMTVRIPLVVNTVEIPEPETSQRIDASETLTESTTKVLLVDDNSVNRQLGRTILERLGCAVTLANDGNETLERIKSDVPDIIFLDCQMPIMDGYETTTEIRHLEQSQVIHAPNGRDHIIIIALTANTATEDRARCLNLGMNDYLRKPCLQNDYMMMLKRYAI